jgi:SAM-dependent methyltransferase
MRSPLTQKNNTRLIKTYPAETIIGLYKDNLSIDVRPYLAGVDNVNLFECVDSAYRFYYPLSVEGPGDFYERLINTNYQYYPGWKWENNIASAYVGQNDRVIDVGCGDGTFLDLLGKKRPGVHLCGVEFNAEAIRQATARGLHIYRQPVQALAEEQPGQYDIATTFQVLEHIADVHSFLEAKVALVKKGGRIIIGVPHNNPYIYRKDKYHVLNLPPHHMGLWGEKSLSSLERYFPIKLEKIHIEPVDDLFYYLFVQMSMTGLYSKMYSKQKFFRAGGRLFNKLFYPLSRMIKGRNIVAVYKKL